MRGVPLTFGRSDLEIMSRIFSPSIKRAPLVRGHPDGDNPEEGEILALVAVGGSLYCIGNVSDSLYSDVKANRFISVSLALYLPDAEDNPMPGFFYPKHCGFLGAVGPAVRGMQPPSFASGNSEICFSQSGFGVVSESDPSHEIYLAAVDFQRASGCDFAFAAGVVERAAIKFRSTTIEKLQ